MVKTMRLRIAILLAAAFVAQSARAQAPTNLRAESPASLQPHVTLTWDAPAGLSFFKVYRSFPDTNHFQWIGVSANHQYEDPGVFAGVVYNYFVTAVFYRDTALLESGRSNIANVRAYALSAGPKGVIAGKVTDASTGLPLANITVRFFKLPSPTFRGLDITTSTSGAFEAQVDTGTYIIRAEQGNIITGSVAAHRTQWYQNASVPDSATRVPITANDTARIAFILAADTPKPYAYVSGNVTDSLGQPLGGAVVAFLRPIQELVAPTATTTQTPAPEQEAAIIPGVGYSKGVVWQGYTNTSGKFFAQVSSGRDYIALAAKDGYYPEFFDNSFDPTQATIIQVRSDTAGINFSLRSKATTSTGSVSGTVVDSSGTEVAARIILFPRPKEAKEGSGVFAFTDSTGYFVVEDVEEGTYSVLAVPYSDYAPSFATTSGATAVTWLDADSVTVDSTNAPLRISVPPLQKAGLTRISGHVLAANNKPLPGVRIIARATNGTIAGYGLSERDGHYAIEALGDGPVTLLADRFQFNLVQAPVTIPQYLFHIDNVDFVLSSSYPAGVNDVAGVPSQSALYQNYPNPFNPTTVISYQLSSSGGVHLAVYDILGRELVVLVSERKDPGTYAVTWNAAGYASGVYFYRLDTNGLISTRRMVLVK
jgi:hypothetical protein